uniref:Uncharacterized protein n=1 Tax=Setaria italica TaxID=4555 RepID=K3ZKA9_SETIT
MNLAHPYCCSISHHTQDKQSSSSMHHPTPRKKAIISSYRGCTCSCRRSCSRGRSRRTPPPPRTGRPSSPGPRRGRRWPGRRRSSPPGQGTSCCTQVVKRQILAAVNKELLRTDRLFFSRLHA